MQLERKLIISTILNKAVLRISVGTLLNVDVSQRGWNYLFVRFVGDVRAALKSSEQFPFRFVEGKDPRRFFAKGTTWTYDNDEKMLVSPAFRLEFYAQEVQFN